MENQKKFICENCGKEHDGSYGSGRFCSKECARSFSTKANRKETNEKVRSTLLKRYTNIYKYSCEICGKEFKRSTKFRKEERIRCPECKQKRIHFKTNVKSILELSKRTVTKILTRAKKGCAICGWNESTCDIHHIIERHNGGTDDMSNLIILCPNCHRIVHTIKDKYSKEFLQERSIEKTFKDWKDYYHISN